MSEAKIMKTVFTNKFQIVKFDYDYKIMEFTWNEGVSRKLNDKKYIKEIIVGAKLIVKYFAKSILVRYSYFDYPISPNVQEIVNDVILDAYKLASVEKLALIQPKEIIERMAMEQIIEERKATHKFDTKFFFDELKALKWLKE